MDPKADAASWTLATLKQHYDQRMLDQDKAVQAALAAAEKAVAAALAAAEKAVEKSETNSEKWRQNANEWRSAMNDREAKFSMKAEVDGEISSIRAELKLLREYQERSTGKAAGGSALWGYAMGAAGLVLTLMSIAGVLYAVLKR